MFRKVLVFSFLIFFLLTSCDADKISDASSKTNESGTSVDSGDAAGEASADSGSGVSDGADAGSGDGEESYDLLSTPEWAVGEWFYLDNKGENDQNIGAIVLTKEGVYTGGDDVLKYNETYEGDGEVVGVEIVQSSKTVFEIKRKRIASESEVFCYYLKLVRSGENCNFYMTTTEIKEGAEPEYTDLGRIIKK